MEQRTLSPVSPRGLRVGPSFPACSYYILPYTRGFLLVELTRLTSGGLISRPSAQ